MAWIEESKESHRKALDVVLEYVTDSMKKRSLIGLRESDCGIEVRGFSWSYKFRRWLEKCDQDQMSAETRDLLYPEDFLSYKKSKTGYSRTTINFVIGGDSINQKKFYAIKSRSHGHSAVLWVVRGGYLHETRLNITGTNFPILLCKQRNGTFWTQGRYPNESMSYLNLWLMVHKGLTKKIRL